MTALDDAAPARVRASVGGVGWDFNAAHTGLHDGVLEPLHGHTYQVTLTVWGVPDDAGMVADFRLLKDYLRDALAPLKRRTLIATNAPGIDVVQDDGLVHISGGGAWLTLPRPWVTLLPVTSTSTEALATHLAELLAERIEQTCPQVERIEIGLRESAECAATAELVLR